MKEKMRSQGILLKGPWDKEQTLQMEKVVEDSSRLFGGMVGFIAVFHGLRVLYLKSRLLEKIGIRSSAPPAPISTLLGADVVLVNHKPAYIIAHEMGHVWDYRSKYKMSQGLMKRLGTWRKRSAPKTRSGTLDNAEASAYEWHPYPVPEPYPGTPTRIGNKIPAEVGEVTPYAATLGGGAGLNALASKLTKPGMEDWAETFASYLYPEYYDSLNRQAVDPDGIRAAYLKEQAAEAAK